MARTIIPILERFMNLVEPEPNTGCWLWTGSLLSSGYGRFTTGSTLNGDKSVTPAHRVAWQLFRGPIPKGMFVLHTCDQRSCAFHGHLFLGTPQDNMTDMARKRRGITSGLGLPYGVTFVTRNTLRPFRAVMKVNGSNLYIGTFATAEEAGAAAEAYRQKVYNQEPKP